METNVLQHIMRLCRCVLPAILLAASAVMSAQELQITDARRTMEPMTVPMQRLDFNNQICAMVKVELPVAGVQFEGNVVGEPLFKTTEYWVYLTAGTKMLKIKVPGHYSLMADFPELGLGSLESKSIYYLTIKGLSSASSISTTAFATASHDNTMSLTPPDLSQLSVAPNNLDLCAELNGHTVCISKKQWEIMSAGERELFSNKWLYIYGKDKSGKKHRFMLSVKDSGEKMTWEEAMSRYDDSLPTMEQGEAMAKNHKAIDAAIITFGGNKGSMRKYWTRTEYSPYRAYYVNVSRGNVDLSYKTETGRVRTVAPLPSLAM